MEEISKYFSKTALALENLNKSAAELNNATDMELANKDTLKTTVFTLKNALYEKATRIDDIIENLNGALK
ncbi:MAG: hypothetical protein J6W96_06280 [Alphaproteobacteria bacterium]|nr:hypothetical protein [Alphaproteobacteria bacterium]